MVRVVLELQLQALDRLFRGRCAGRGWLRLPYRLLPTERGSFRFGDIHVRLRGPLALAWVDRTIDAEEEAHVYPNLQEVRRYEALHQKLRSSEPPVVARIADGLLLLDVRCLLDDDLPWVARAVATAFSGNSEAC